MPRPARSESTTDRVPASPRGRAVDRLVRRVYVSAVDGSTHHSDADREWSELRAAAAAASSPEPESRTGIARSSWQRATATRWGRVGLTAGAVAVIAGAVVATVLIVSPRHPDAVMRQTAAEPDGLVRGLVAGEAAWVEIDLSTLRAYGSFRGLEIWSGTDTFGSPCLISVNRANDTLSDMRCAPAPAELIMDISSTGDDYDGLGGEGLIRFIHRGDSVAAYVHLMPGTD